MMKTFALALVSSPRLHRRPSPRMTTTRCPSRSMAKVTAALADLGCEDQRSRKNRASTRSTMPSAEDAARWTSSSTRTSSFLFRTIQPPAFLARNATSSAHNLSGPPKGGPDLRSVFFFALASGARRAARAASSASNCAQLRILPAHRLASTLRFVHETDVVRVAGKTQGLRLPWPRSMPKLGAAPVRGHTRISRSERMVTPPRRALVEGSASDAGHYFLSISTVPRPAMSPMAAAARDARRFGSLELYLHPVYQGLATGDSRARAPAAVRSSPSGV